MLPRRPLIENVIRNQYDPLGIVHTNSSQTLLLGHTTSNIITHCTEYAPFLFCKNWRTFVLGDFVVGVYADDQIMAQRFGLPQRVGVAKMYHVKTEGKKTIEETRRRSNG